MKESLAARPIIASSGARLQVREWDIVAMLSVWLVLLYGISADQTIGPLGAIGQPSMLVAAVIALMWVSSRMVPGMAADHGIQPLRLTLLALLWYQAAIWARGHLRHLTQLEQLASVRELVAFLVLTGVALAVMDGVQSLERLETLLRRLVWMAGFTATIALGQFFTGMSFLIRIPGLSLDRDLSVAERGILNRSQATAQHPIELSVLLAALLPLAIHVALTSERGSWRRRMAVAVAILMGFVLPLAVSRSGIVVLLVSMPIMALGWTWRQRAKAAIVAIAAIPIFWLAVPGLVGTFRGLLFETATDPSVQARLDRFPRFMNLFNEYPWFGRGFGTYTPEDYFLLDNEVYVMLIEVGIIGLLLFTSVVSFGALVAISSRHHDASTAESSSLGYAIAAGILGLLFSMATFDALFYVILRNTLYLLLGASGALWRLTRDDANRLAHVKAGS